MFSSLFGYNPLDDLIDKATSENLPSGQEDIALNLEISDQIRSKTFNPKDVITSLRRRLRHTNPNVQLLALLLADTCVKNGGDHFLKEVASRDFMDDLVSILKHPGGINPQVKNKILECIQNWSNSFKNRPELNYTNQIYGALKAQGYTFPPPEAISSAIIDTKIAPEWTDSEVCMRCRTAFTFTNRKHHCRNCGQTFCHSCSGNAVPLRHFGINDPVRVCTGCYLGIKRVSNESTSLSLSEFISTETPSAPMDDNTTKNDTYGDVNGADFDADLKKAIELSLKEAGGQAYSSPKTISTFTKETQPQSQPKEEEDPDLAAAIAASLKDMEITSKRVSDYGLSYEPQKTYEHQSYKPELPPYNLTDKEIQNLSLFSKLIEAINNNPSSRMEPSIHNLYSDISSLTSKLALSINDSTKKHSQFVELQGKLASAVKLYDSLLEKSINRNHYAYANAPASNYNNGTAPPNYINSAQSPSQHSQYSEHINADSRIYPEVTAPYAYAPPSHNYTDPSAVPSNDYNYSANLSQHYQPTSNSAEYHSPYPNLQENTYQPTPGAPPHASYSPQVIPGAPYYANYTLNQVTPATPYTNHTPNQTIPGAPAYSNYNSDQTVTGAPSHEAYQQGYINPDAPQAPTYDNQQAPPQSKPQDAPLIEL